MTDKTETLMIRPDMHPDARELPQHYSVAFLDKFLLKAFTARTEEEVLNAERTLADVQEQCLKHIRFLSEIESFYRIRLEAVGFDHDEAGYNDAITFLADMGVSLAGVTHQLGFAGTRYAHQDTPKASQ